MRRLVFVGLLAVTVALFVVPALADNDDNPNEVAFWCDDGMKLDNLSGSSFTVPDPPDGATWTLLVIKAATTNTEIPFPVPGQTYFPSNDNDVSHVILCYVEGNGTTTSTTTTSSTTTTVPSTTTTTPTTTTTTTVPETTTTTTTTPETTTTTVPETTTTTVVETTTTTQPGATTTEPPPNGGVPAGGGAMAAILLDDGPNGGLILGGGIMVALAVLLGGLIWANSGRRKD